MVDITGQVEQLANRWREQNAGLSRIPGADSADARAAAAALSGDLEKARGFFSDFRLFLYVDALRPVYGEIEEGLPAVSESDMEEARRLIFGEQKKTAMMPRACPFADLRKPWSVCWTPCSMSFGAAKRT